MKVIAIDFDGIISKNEIPIKKNIGAINRLFENPDNYIVIHTARSRKIYNKTYDWLIKNNVKFHALVMEKMRATVYIDDKNYKTKEAIHESFII